MSTKSIVQLSIQKSQKDSAIGQLLIHGGKDRFSKIQVLRYEIAELNRLIMRQMN